MLPVALLVSRHTRSTFIGRRLRKCCLIDESLNDSSNTFRKTKVEKLLKWILNLTN